MSFLVHGRVTNQVPPDLAVDLTDAYLGYVKKWKSEGAVDQVWNYVGCLGGCMVVNLESVDELDRMLMEHPFVPFMEVKVEPLVEAEAGSERFKDVFREMMLA